MEEKERVDALMKLAEFHMQHRKERREIEWRISLAIWGLSCRGDRHDRLKQHSEGDHCTPFYGLRSSDWRYFFHGLWIVANLARNVRDSDRAYTCVNHARALLELPPIKIGDVDCGDETKKTLRSYLFGHGPSLRKAFLQSLPIIPLREP
jgi:hypothetical protein